MSITDDGARSESCDKCERMSRPCLYDDVYKGDCNKGLTSQENIADPTTGKPIPYSSVGEKVAIMKRLNIRQSPNAELQHGARNEVKRRTHFV